MRIARFVAALAIACVYHPIEAGAEQSESSEAATPAAEGGQATATPGGTAPPQAPRPDLEQVELRAKASSAKTDLLVVLFSNTNGWGSAASALAGQLSERGVDVVGIDTLGYLSSGRTPDSATGDLTRLLLHYTQSWKPRRIVILGHGLGAGILPYMISRISPTLSRQVVTLVLVEPPAYASFDFRISDLLLSVPRNVGYPVSRELEDLHATRVLCMLRDEDVRSPCRELERGPVTTVTMTEARDSAAEAAWIVSRLLASLP